MKYIKSLLIVLLLLLVNHTIKAQSDIYFSKYVEGSGYDKALELYNPTNNTIDLSNYEISIDTDGLGFGTGARTFTLRLKGKLPAKTSYLMAREVSKNEELKFLADTTLRSNILNFNGNEQILLTKLNARGGHTITLDKLGYPGSTYNMRDMTLVRKSSTAPNYGNVQTPLSNEWDKKSYTDLSCLKLAPGSSNLGVSVDKSKSVGTIAGRANVSASGAAIYNIPISVLPGINGLKPNLAVVYNSQGGNGIMGKAWNLSGLSAISRVPKTIYHDGENYSISCTTTDRLALDGNRLVEAPNDVYWDSSAEYFTEIANFSKISTRGSGTDTYFIVETKDGKTLEYGNSTTAKIKYGKTTRKWLLNKVEDQNKNTIIYEYEGGRIKKITYNNNSIVFTYSTNRNPVKTFFLDQSITFDKILTNIDIKYNNGLLYGYKLEYYKNNSNNTDELIKIKQYNSNYEELNPTQIIWERDNSFAFNSVDVQSAKNNYSFTDQRYATLDYNGDGLDDMIGIYKKTDGNYIWQLYINNTQQGQKVNFVARDFSEIGKDYVKDTYLEKNLGIIAVDIKGNGQHRAFSPSVRSTEDKASFYFRDFNKALDVQTTDFSLTKMKNLFLVTDFDSNGKQEITSIYKEHGSLDRCYIEVRELGPTESGFQKKVKTQISLNESFKITNTTLLYGDFNFNNQPDILLFTDKGTYICEKEADGNDFEITLLSNLIVSENDMVKSADFNGDGKKDVIISDHDGSKNMKFLRSSPNGLKDMGINYIKSLNDPRTGKDDEYNNIMVVDFNKDGKEDIILFKADYDRNSFGKYHFNKLSIIHYQATGIGFTKLEQKDISNSHCAKSKYFVSGDFDGDGKTDILNYGYQYLKNYDSATRWRMLTHTNNNFDVDLVKSITDGFGNNTTFTYRTLSDKAIVSDNILSEAEKKNWRTQGVVPYFEPLHIVSNITRSNGIGGITEFEYKYNTPLVHKHGRGLLGFLQTTIKNTSSNTIEKTHYELNNSHIINQVWKKEVHVGSKMVSSSENNYHFEELGDKRFFSYIDHNTQSDGLKDIKTTSSFIYDTNGNLTSQITDYDGDATVKIANTYNKYGAWCSSRLTNSSTTTTYSGETSFSQSSTYKYYDNGNLKSEEANGIKTSYTYDSYGNPDIVTVSASGEANRLSDYNFDASHRFVETLKDPLGQVVQYQYDPWGNITQYIDIADNTTRHRYNAWGQLVESINPDGNMTEYRTSWADNNNTGALYYAYTKTDGSAYVKTFYDMLGREIGSETEGFNGKVYTSQKYNTKGLVVSSLSPHYSGGTTILSRTSYDAYNRPKSIDVNGVKTSYSYKGLETSISAPNQYTTKTYNALGNILVSTDKGGTISYQYHSSGQTKSITSNKNTVSMTYYPNGLQKTLSDPDAGTITYVYNGFGELKTQSDNKGNVTSIKYDNAGRIEQKTCGTFSSEYKYYPSGKQIGLLQKVVNSNSTETQYQYNNYGQPTLVREKVEGKTFDTSYSYDDYGRVNSISYPSNFTVSRTYNANGFLNEVRRGDNGKRIWKASSYNALGQAMSYLSGNGKLTQKTVDNNGRLTSIRTDYSRIQNLNYRFDSSTGNLMERRDRRNGINETFAYDGVNRLKSATNNFGSKDFHYDIKGNITYKTNVGDYKYESSQPHAVTSISNEDGLISTRQDITYTAFNKVKTIEQGDCNLSFTYGHDYARRKTVLHKKGPVVMTKYFIGNYEQKEDGLSGEVSKISYIMGGDGLAAIHIFDNSGSKMLYVHKDHLGSIQCLTNDNTSNNYGIVQEYSYDAWGMRTHLKKAGFNHDYSYKDLCRGYTGHEHLHEFGLINMNGRLYDPLLGRFLSPDNYVQFPNYTQNYNRFAYCLNNPLIYTDPTGQTIVGNFFKWVKKNTWDPFWDAANNFAQWADQNGIPAAGYGYNSGLGTYHYFGYSGNIYHSQVRGMNNAPQVVENAVSEARQENNNGMIAPNGDYYPYSFQGKMPDGKYWHGCMACHHPDGAYVPWMEIGGYHQLSEMIFTSVLGAGAGEVVSSLTIAARSGVNITYLTRAGKYPGWNTVKARYWKLMNRGRVPTGTAKVRIRATGEIKNIKVSKELHHINGRTGTDPHRFNNLKEVWPWEHQAIDSYRHTGYDFIQWIK